MSEPKEVWTVLKILNWTQDFFKKKNIDSARLDAEILLAQVLKCSRMFLYVNYEQPLTAGELAEFKGLILRRAAGESVAYILGEKQFMHYTLKVNSAVLVPRPETELLVEAVLDRFTDENLQVLDMCTGSGAIAVALAGYRPTWRITAVDASEEALGVARENAQNLNYSERVEFYHSDMFAQIPLQRYRVIVSNPPYIDEKERNTLSPEVLCEPHMALFAPEKGLYFYRVLAQQAGEWLTENGCIFVEFGRGQAEDIRALFEQDGFKDIEVLRDYADIERIMVIRK